MPHGCTEEDLVELFSKFGRVHEVRINQKQGRETAGRGRDGKAGFVSETKSFLGWLGGWFVDLYLNSV